MRSLNFPETTPREGDVLAHNVLWRSGAHERWEFFEVSHVTAAGNVMLAALDSHYLGATWDESQNACYRVKPGPRLPDHRARRLRASAGRYYILTPEDVATGVTEERLCR